MTRCCRPQRAWDLLLQRTPAAALAAAAAPDAVAGWFALAATPTGARVRAELLLAPPLPERRRGSAAVGSGEVHMCMLLFFLDCLECLFAKHKAGRSCCWRRRCRTGGSSAAAGSSEEHVCIIWILSLSYARQTQGGPIIRCKMCMSAVFSPRVQAPQAFDDMMVLCVRFTISRRHWQHARNEA